MVLSSAKRRKLELKWLIFSFLCLVVIISKLIGNSARYYNRTLIWGESWNYLHILDLVTFGRRMRRNATLDRIQ
jgi:hypothetical protein